MANSQVCWFLVNTLSGSTVFCLPSYSSAICHGDMNDIQGRTEASIQEEIKSAIYIIRIKATHLSPAPESISQPITHMQ